jgi:mannose-6-phosphate isomerase-like protein (cupin superfamily)
MNIAPVHKLTVTKYFWGDHCESFVLADTEGLSVKQEVMPPCTKEQLHYHLSAQQFFYILRGTATFYVDSVREMVREQWGLLIPAGATHFIANETDAPLEFLIISQPTTNKDRITI